MTSERAPIDATRRPTIAVIGTGPVGRAIAAAYVAAGGNVAAIVSRSAERALAVARACGPSVGAAAVAGCSWDAARTWDEVFDVEGVQVWIVAVPDRAIPEVGVRLPTALSLASSDSPLTNPALVLHTSGALTGAELTGAELGGGGLESGSLHPLQTLTSGPNEPNDIAELGATLRGCHWFHEGSGAPDAAGVVALLGGHFHALQPGSKGLYHAAAAVLSNHTVALHAVAVALLEHAGLSRGEVAAPLDALLSGTLANLRRHGQPSALTGPVARGDVDTVRRHLTVLSTTAPEHVESYRHMALEALEVARCKGLNATDAAALQTLLVDWPGAP